jgi:hypothetical protein
MFGKLSSKDPDPKSPILKFLTPHDIGLIEEALIKVGAFGEIHLVVERGRLRFIRTVKSESLNGDHNENT